MANDDSIADLVVQAKNAVVDLEEPYRMEAFKIVLDRLISGTGEPLVATNSKKAKKKKSKHSNKNVRKKTAVTSTNGPEAKTSLDLSTEQLKKLKDYYSIYKPSGGELCAFVLSMFLYNELSMKLFNEADIDYLYRSLISMKTKVPNVSDWKRALNWLCVKSRKKEWLKREGDSYTITNAGLIAFNEMDALNKKTE